MGSTLSPAVTRIGALINRPPWRQRATTSASCGTCLQQYSSRERGIALVYLYSIVTWQPPQNKLFQTNTRACCANPLAPHYKRVRVGAPLFFLGVLITYLGAIAARRQRELDARRASHAPWLVAPWGRAVRSGLLSPLQSGHVNQQTTRNNSTLMDAQRSQCDACAAQLDRPKVCSVLLCGAAADIRSPPPRGRISALVRNAHLQQNQSFNFLLIFDVRGEFHFLFLPLWLQPLKRTPVGARSQQHFPKQGVARLRKIKSVWAEARE